MKRRAWRLGLMLLGLVTVAVACGRTRDGGEGSETHWLSACVTNDQCAIGECLCGVCTLPCSSVRECPAPLDQCLAEAPGGGECAAPICQQRGAGLSPQALQPEAPPELERLPSCDSGRSVDFVRADEQVFPDPAGYQTRVVSDGGRGFLVFGRNLDGFLSLSPRGDFVRQLPQPAFEPRPRIDHAVALDDGSLLLAGRVGESQLEHAFVGKLDANWRPLWQRQLETQGVTQTALVTLPDGGALLAGVHWLDGLEAGGVPDDLSVARFEAEGELLWERRVSFDGPHPFADQPGFPVLALNGPRFHVVVPADDGVFLFGGDLDGNLDEASEHTRLPESLRLFGTTGAAEPIGVEALPDGEVAVFSARSVLVLSATHEPKLEYAVSAPDVIVAARFDPARAELMIAGHYTDIERSALPGPWMRALRLDGEVSWEARRAPLTLDDQGELQAGEDAAPPLIDAAIDDRGNMLMTGQIGRGLEWAWVGADACGG